MEIIDLKVANLVTLEQVATIIVAGYKRHYPQAWPDMDAARLEAQEALEPNRYGRIALNDAGNILGWIGAIPEYGGNAWNLHPLVVDPGSQGQGIGRALVTEKKWRLNFENNS